MRESLQFVFIVWDHFRQVCGAAKPEPEAQLVLAKAKLLRRETGIPDVNLAQIASNARQMPHATKKINHESLTPDDGTPAPQYVARSAPARPLAALSRFARLFRRQTPWRIPFKPWIHQKRHAAAHLHYRKQRNTKRKRNAKRKRTANAKCQ